MSDGRKKNGNKEGLVKAREVMRQYIKAGKSIQDDATNSDDEEVFTADDFKDLEPLEPKEEVGEISHTIETPKEDPYKAMYEAMQKEVSSLKEQYNQPKATPVVKVVEKTRKQIMDDQLRAQLTASFN